MANSDAAQYTLRYNEITGDLEAQVGLTWQTILLANSGGITQLTGDVTAGPGTGSQAATLTTVNTDVGSFTYGSFTVNAKGLITAASSGTAPVTSVSGTANDISSTGGTTPILDLINTAVTPGSYTNTNLTVDANGRITAASNGSGGSSVTPSVMDNTASSFSTASTTYVATGVKITGFALTNSANKVKISVQGPARLDFAAPEGGLFLTIMRDGVTDLANADGLIEWDFGGSATGLSTDTQSVCFIGYDPVGDTSPHTYEVYLHIAFAGATMGFFPTDPGAAQIICEEIV